MSDRSRRELEERIDELEATLEELRGEVGPRRGPMGLPAPPGPREMLRFTDEYAIPAAIAALEANVRALELLQAGIRATDPERAVDETGRVLSDRASGVGRASLDRLDRALSDLESALEGPGTPGDPEARDLLSDARRLNEEIRDMIGAGSVDRRTSATGRGRDRDDVIRIDVESAEEAEGPSGRPASSPDRSVEEEIESELETVKEEVESEGRQESDDEVDEDE